MARRPTPVGSARRRCARAASLTIAGPASPDLRPAPRRWYGPLISGLRITIVENGPYMVDGSAPLTEQALTVDASGNTWDYEARMEYETAGRYALCRCGRSQNKPFCDGSHAKVDFDGTETASRAPFEERAELFDGPAMSLRDVPALCAFARICDGHGRVWNGVLEAADAASREVVAHQAGYCPSGRLVARDKQGADSAIEPAFELSVVLIEDPQESASGPIWVRGGASIIAADGTEYERRNRVTLCRCGQSSNKPFCDGTHAHVGFNAHEPT